MTDQMNQKLTSDVNIKTFDINLKVDVTKDSANEFRCIASIDEAGQIVLTPVVEEMSFVNVFVSEDSDDSNLCIRATMLMESDTTAVNTFIDSIGQCIIQPETELNTFVSASINDSLNLITEDTDNNKQEDDEKATSEEETDVKLDDADVKAEVLDEQIIDPDNVVEVAVNEIESCLAELTQKFTEPQGKIQCDTIKEKTSVEEILSGKYATVNTIFKDGKYLITYQQVREA